MEYDWDDILDFGQHKGETVRNIWFTNPDYLIWLLYETDTEFTKEVLDTLNDY